MTNHLTTAEYRDQVNRSMTEKQLQDKCEATLRGLGALVYHTYDSRRSAAGFPDLVVITRDNRLGVFELKTERGRLTDAQGEWLNRLSRVEEITVAVVRPADYDWLIDWARGEI